MQKITTTLRRKWFAEIVDGAKRIEYRDTSPYWIRRLQGVQVPFMLVLRNGMRPLVPVVTVQIDRVLKNVPQRQHELRIGEVLKVEHWDRRRKCP